MNKVNILSRQDIVSSNIKSIGYDPGTNTLEVEFKAKGKNPEKIYQYQPVTPPEYDELMKADSIGSHFNSTIRINPNIFYKQIQ